MNVSRRGHHCMQRLAFTGCHLFQRWFGGRGRGVEIMSNLITCIIATLTCINVFFKLIPFTYNVIQNNDIV